jgi:hypothetical protein
MATRHLTDDELILHYYGETEAPQEPQVSSHLEACGLCRGEYARLQRVLGVIDERTVAVEPHASFERTMWARLEPNLRPAQRRWLSWLFMSPAPLGLAAAVVVLVAAAFFAGRALSPAPASSPAAAAASAAPEEIRERILLTDLGQHLDRSQMALVELVSAGDDASSLASERSRAELLVADTRLYRQTAEETGDVALSELLDEIERVLTEVAASPESGSSADLSDVRQRIESRDLLFKVRVVSSAIRERQKTSTQRQAGPRS